jgi:glycosyltransferase involved in cell wall biosynthesis
MTQESSAVAPAPAPEKNLAQLEEQVKALKADIGRLEKNDRLRKLVEAHIPTGAKVIVVSKGDSDLVEMRGRHGLHFPQGDDGAWLGYHPATSDDAIAHLEELRAAGAEYFIVPAASSWWLQHYTRLKEHLEQRYHFVASQEDAGVIYRLALRTRPLQHTFSVVICTYNRAALLANAIDSIFKQDYPRDKFEIIIIDNDSPDDTAEVVARYARQSSVPFSYHVETRKGTSHARNLGVAKARNDYIAFLDDDETAAPNWLASFDQVINDHKALVVGGRYEKVFADGFVPPDWFNFQYVKGLFGVNYREWGKKETVFRIDKSYYLAAGNSAYARQLFQYFGSYSTQLGHVGTISFAGEETYFNMVLEKHGIPIFYTDAAVIYHHIERSRTTKKHIRQKARWSGMCNAMIHTMFYGFRETRKMCRGRMQELKTLLQAVRRNPGDPQNFSRNCRIIYNYSYLRKFKQLQLKRLMGMWRPIREPASYDLRGWIAEVRALPKKQLESCQRLYDLYVALSDTTRARRVHEKLMRLLAKENPAGGTVPAPSREARKQQYRELVRRVQQTVAAHVPAGARIVVASKGDEELIKLADRQGWHFPQAKGGEFAGCYPKNSAEAIAHLEALRSRGGDYFLLPQTALWWLEHYPGFKEHLEKNYALTVRQDDTCLVFALRGAGERNGVNGQAAHSK